MNIQSDFLRASCRIRTNDPEITNHVLWPTELKRQRIYFNMFLFRASCRIRTNDPEITNHVLWPTELKRQGNIFQYVLFRASCRIRTNDPEITNHVLWPTELKRQVGKLTISPRRYNQLPLLRSSPGGFEGSWPYGTYPCYVSQSINIFSVFPDCGCKGRYFFQLHNYY